MGAVISIGRRTVGQIVLIVLPMILVACVVIATALERMREDTVADAQRANGTMASILSQQVFQSVQAIDLVLDDLVAMTKAPDVVSDDDLRRKMASNDFHEFLLNRLEHLPQADLISVFDSNGKFIASSESWPPPDANVSGRDPFDYLQQHKDLSLFIGPRELSRISGNSSVYFSRRLENRHGDFLGTVTVGVRPEFFLRLYEGISAVPGAFVRVLRRDGTVLVSYPEKDHRAKLSETGQWRAFLKSGGQFLTSGHMHSKRLVAERPVERYPLIINAGVNEATVLDLWASRAKTVGLGGILVALAVTALVCFLFFLYRKAVETQAQLTAQSKELSDANLRFDTVLSNMKHGVAMFDGEDQIVIHNRSFAEMYGLTNEDMPPGTQLATIIELRIARGIYGSAGPADYRYRHLTEFEHLRHGSYSELEHLRDGRTIHYSHRPMPGGGWITTHEDVTARHQAAVQIVHMARHDALTGLANRNLFLECVGEAAQGGDTCFAVLIVDLDEFKAVNDTFGHPAGDALLVAVAARLGAATGPEDIVARLGGDEFAILQRLPKPDTAAAVALAARLLHSIREPYQVEDRELKIGLSIGIASTTGAAVEPSTIMRNADLALYRAKADGRNCYRLFDPAMAEEIQSRRELAIALDLALARGELAVHYQPIVDAVTLDTVAMEALARWRDPVHGDVSPDLFIPLAEEAGLITRLGAFVLERACRDALNWPASVKVSVNVSPIQVTRSDLVAAVRHALVKTCLSPQRLQIEITESVLLGDNDHNLAVLQELRSTGAMIVLDDFGKGFSSLGYLNRFPLDKIKIDRSFVERFGIDAGSGAIVSAVTSIAHAFQAVTIAEGVENEQQYRLLRATTVAEMQGYLFGSPQPAAAWTFQGLKAKARPPGRADAIAA